MRGADQALHWLSGRALFHGGLLVFWLLVIMALLLLLFDWLLRPDTYPVRSVGFEGEFVHVTQQRLEQAALTGLRGSFYTLDLDAVKGRVEALPWVYRAWVSRRWPNAVHVRFMEQEFIARWGAGAWINVQGEVVALPARDGPDSLPVLSGPDGSARQVLATYRELRQLLEPAGMRIRRLELSSRRMWQLALANGATLVVGRETPAAKVARFVRVYPYLLAKKTRRARRVDLRYANGLAVEWADDRLD